MWFESKDAPESLESIISKQLCESGPEFIYLLENPKNAPFYGFPFWHNDYEEPILKKYFVKK